MHRFTAAAAAGILALAISACGSTANNAASTADSASSDTISSEVSAASSASTGTADDDASESAAENVSTTDSTAESAENTASLSAGDTYSNALYGLAFAIPEDWTVTATADLYTDDLFEAENENTMDYVSITLVQEDVYDDADDVLSSYRFALESQLGDTDGITIEDAEVTFLDETLPATACHITDGDSSATLMQFVITRNDRYLLFNVMAEDEAAREEIFALFSNI